MLKICKRGAIYLPKRILNQLNIQEGDKLLLKVENNRIILELVPDPLSLALKTKKWTKISVEEFEEDSEREQHELYET